MQSLDSGEGGAEDDHTPTPPTKPVGSTTSIARGVGAILIETVLYLGRPLETIRREIAAGRFAGLDADEASAEIQRAQRSPR